MAENTADGYWSMDARCACCGHQGFRFDNGLCGSCCYLEHDACQDEHYAIRRTRPRWLSA